MCLSNFTCSAVGSGQRYQVLSHVFARCVSQKVDKKHTDMQELHVFRVQVSQVRVFFDLLNVQKSVTQIIYLGPLPTAQQSTERCALAAGILLSCTLPVWGMRVEKLSVLAIVFQILSTIQGKTMAKPVLLLLFRFSLRTIFSQCSSSSLVLQLINLRKVRTEN